MTVVWEITHIYPLHVGPWQRSLPRSPGSQETPPQNRTKQYRNKHPILGQEATDIRTIQHRTRVKKFEGSNRTKILQSNVKEQQVQSTRRHRKRGPSLVHKKQLPINITRYEIACIGLPFRILRIEPMVEEKKTKLQKIKLEMTKLEMTRIRNDNKCHNRTIVA